MITLNGASEIRVVAGGQFEDPGAVWNDLFDGNGIISGTGELNLLNPGVYVLHYNKTDRAGNVAETVTRTVMVINDDPDKLRFGVPTKWKRTYQRARRLDAFRGAIRMIRRAGENTPFKLSMRKPRNSSKSMIIIPC